MMESEVNCVESIQAQQCNATMPLNAAPQMFSKGEIRPFPIPNHHFILELCKSLGHPQKNRK